MGILASSPSSFVAGTRARAADMNNMIATVTGDMIAGGMFDHWATGYRVERLSTATSTTITGNTSFMCSYFTIPTASTFDLATSTARLACLGDMDVPTNSTFHIASGAEAKIL